MTTQHTPGPWELGRVSAPNTGATPIRWKGESLAWACGKDSAHGFDEATARANARLIAAAPELLEELCNAREWLDELCGLIQFRRLDAACDWVGANAVSTDSTLAATIEKAMGEPVMAA